MDRAEHQMAGFGGLNRRQERFPIAHFADQNDIGVFAHRMLHPHAEVDHVDADLALIDQAFVFGEREFDRVFQRQNMLAIPGR